MPIARAPAATATSARFAMRSTAAKNTHELPVPTHARTRTLFAAATSLLRRRLSDACMTTPLARADARRWRSAKVPQSRDVDCRRCSRLWELALRGTVTMVDLGVEEIHWPGRWSFAAISVGLDPCSPRHQRE